MLILRLIEQVLRLEVTMDDTEAVAVSDGINDRSDRIRGFLLTVTFFLDDAVEEFATSQQFENEEDIILLVKNFYQFYSIGVI